jgi:phosphoserine aminotransferase
MTTARPINFYAGPAILPLPVLEEAARGVVALPGVGLSVLEVSHRTPGFEGILFDARDRIRRLLGVPETHDILFLQGGARGHFAQLALNFLRPGTRAGYVTTGTWAMDALAEARLIGDTVELATSEPQGFRELPSLEGVEIPSDLAYFHTTSNNTVYGTQWPELPHPGPSPHISDMSSDFLSRRVDVSRFAMIYGGAQKNIGPAGVVIVILQKAFMAAGRQDIPKIWRYHEQAKQDSMLNTPPCFAIYCVGLMAGWLEAEGGLAAIEARNDAKARLLYGAIDGSNGFYRGVVTNPAHRSRMNVTFRLPDEAREKRFVQGSTEAGLIGLKGHRSVGGLRASIYNAMPLEGVARLVDFMHGFARSA